MNVIQLIYTVKCQLPGARLLQQKLPGVTRGASVYYSKFVASGCPANVGRSSHFVLCYFLKFLYIQPILRSVR